MTADCRRPPEGAIQLGRLIELLQGCLDSSEVSPETWVRVEPEFGIPQETLFASGVAIAYIAQAETPPAVIIEWRREHLGEDQRPEFPLSIENGSVLMNLDLARRDRVLANKLRRRNYSAAYVWNLSTDLTAAGSWYDLLDIPHVGLVRVLNLVNVFRERGLEAPWFADFDKYTEERLAGRRRVPPVKGEAEQMRRREALGQMVRGSEEAGHYQATAGPPPRTR